ncbi:MAG: cupredoxin domain-containing protein [Desulfurococcales archaeon]|nr:cupredoxin domain-containing protein [Desulfurococcales archaeon]
MVLRRDLIIGIGAVVVVIVAVSIYLYSGLLGWQWMYGPPQTQRTTGVPVSREIEVELNDYYFKPKTISIPLGEAVRIVLKNVGRSTHTFTIDELGINMRLAPGETKSIEITASKAGSYVLYCIPHRALGMVGISQ